MLPTNGGDGPTLSISDLLNKIERHPSVIAFFAEARDLTVIRASQMAKENYAVLGIPALVGLNVMEVIQIVAPTLFNENPIDAGMFVRQQRMAWKYMKAGFPDLETTYLFWHADHGRCVTVTFSSVPEVTGEVLGYAVMIEKKRVKSYEYEDQVSVGKRFLPIAKDISLISSQHFAKSTTGDSPLMLC